MNRETFAIFSYLFYSIGTAVFLYLIFSWVARHVSFRSIRNNEDLIDSLVGNEDVRNDIKLKIRTSEAISRWKYRAVADTKSGRGLSPQWYAEQLERELEEIWEDVMGIPMIDTDE